MAKKIRFPLEMENGVEVRTIEELIDNFSLQKVLQYFENGKLLVWLKDRYADDIANEIENLDKSDVEFTKKLCDIFGVEYSEEDNINIEEIEERNRKLSILKEYTDDKRFIDAIDYIAFNQDDLYDLLDENAETIYLCGEKFSIPLGKENISYIGINTPIVVISSKEKIDLNSKGIQFENCTFDEKYLQVISSDKKENKQIKLFADNMIEDIDEFIDEINNYCSDEDLYCTSDLHWFSSDYEDGEYNYSTKAQAKLACKSTIENAIDDIKTVLEDEKDCVVSTTENYLDGLVNKFDDYVELLSSSYDNYVELYCSDLTAKFVKQNKQSCFDIQRDINSAINIGNSIMKSFSPFAYKSIMRASFNCFSEIENSKVRTNIDFSAVFEKLKKNILVTDENVFNLNRYLEICTYDSVGGEYCFKTEDACELLKSIVSANLGCVQLHFPDTALKEYKRLMIEWFNNLKDKVLSLVHFNG